MRSFFSYMIGIIMGALVGATAAVLLAPSSGEDLRGELKTRFDKFSNELSTAASDSRAELEKQLKTMRSGSKEA